MKAQILRCAALALALVFSGAALADKLAESDQEFLEQAAQNSLAEESASRLAKTMSRDQRVLDYAQRLLDDHAGMGAELQALAAAKAYTPPKQPSVLQKGKELLIANMGDKNFDRRFISQVGIDAHEDTIRLFDEAARQARDPDVKAFAAKHLPMLREHLRIAQTLRAAIDPPRGNDGQR